MSSQGRGDRSSVKIVIINTKYVETDAMSFKDVVQKLTGKDSKVAYETQEPPPATDTSTSSPYSDVRDIDEGLSNGVRSSSSTNSHSNNPVGFMTSSTRNNSSVMMRNISFKELEILFREMPPMEEFWTTDY